jgi:hypothetical protein
MPDLLLGVGKGGGAGGDGHVIVSILALEDKAEVTTEASHGLASFTDIHLTGTVDYNDDYLGVIQVTGATTFHLGDGSYKGDNTGPGMRWELGSS